MSRKAMPWAVSVLLIASFILSACAQTTPTAPAPAPTQPQPAATVVPPTTAPTEKPAAPTATTAAPEPTKAAAPLDFTFTNIGWGAPPVYPSAMSDWLEKKFNLKLQPEWLPWDQWETKTNVYLSTGDIPMMMHLPQTSASLYSTTQVDAIQAGLFRDLTPIIQSPDFATKYPNIAKVPAQQWKNLTFEGKIYALPGFVEPVTFNSLCIRKDLWDKAGLTDADLPKTTDDLMKVMEKLKPVAPDGGFVYDAASANLDADQYKALANAFTGVQDWAVAADGTFTYQAFMPEYKGFLNYMKAMYDKGLISPEFSLGKNGDDWASGKVALQMFRWHVCTRSLDTSGQGQWTVQGWHDTVPERYTAQLMDLPPVQGPKGYAIDALRGFWTQYVFSAKLTDAQLAQILTFVDYLYSDEWSFANLKMPILKTLGYAETKDGKDITTDKWNSDGAVAWTWFGFRDWGGTPDDWVRNQTTTGAPEEDLKAIQAAAEAHFKAYAQDTTIRPLALQYFSPTYNSKWGELTSELNDNRIKFIMGQMDEKAWDDYVQKVTSNETYTAIQAELKAAREKTP